MSILKIKDGNGKVIEVAAIKGESAYQIAVRNGFKGTEEEWLAYIYDSENREYIESLKLYGQKDIYTGKITNREATDFSFIKFGIPDVPEGSTVYVKETTLQEELDKKVAADDLAKSISGKVDKNGSTERLHIGNLSVNEINNGAVGDFSFIKAYGTGTDAKTLQDELDNINDSIGDVETALDNILALQQSYIGGDGV